MHMTVLRGPAALIALALAAAPTRAQIQLELGKMWTFENPPLAYLEEEYGFAADADWLAALRLASLRFGDWCSASFVSPKGLIMTNHHCVRDNIAEVSPPGEDWVKHGFYARSLEDEVRIPGLTVQQLASTRDVTQAMLEATEGLDDAAAAEQRDANQKAILAAAKADHPGLKPEIVKLHQGAAYHLYLYNVYDDVRLVCAPHLQTAHFGGDPDNFTYPRYSIDFAFCRAYVDGEPADTGAHYFRWNSAGAGEGDLVFVTGNPGSTGRLLTTAQMEYMRDANYPVTLGLLRSRLAILRDFVRRFPVLEEQLRTIILGDENSVKALDGYLGGLQDETLMQQKRAFEGEFRAAVEAEPALAERFGGVWSSLADLAAEKTALEAKLQLQVPSYSPHLAKAVAIVQAVDPQTSEEEREIAREMVGEIEVGMSPLQQALFIDHVNLAVRWLGEEDPYVALLTGNGPAAMASVLLAGSKIGDPELVQALLGGGMEAVNASEDHAVVVARQLVPMMAENLRRSEEIAAREASQEQLVGQALYAVYGDSISPDATMTLRFSDGRVLRYPYNGTLAPYRTTFYGLFARNTEFGNQDPFHLPELWLERQDRVDMRKAVNFVSTNDIIGGNSGSPVVDTELRVVGLIFDGNIEQLANRFVFRSDSQRSVSVHVEAIEESLQVIYEAQRVLDELRAGAAN